MNSVIRIPACVTSFDMRLPISILFVTAMSVAICDSASAQEEQDPNLWSKRSSLSAHLGLGAPYGLIGVEYEYSFAPWIALAGGIGKGVTDFQIASSMRVRLIRGAWAYGISVGPGFGDYVEESIFLNLFGDKDRRYDDVLWINSEVYAEYRTSSQSLWRMYAGTANGLAWGCGNAPYDDAEVVCQEDAARPKVLAVGGAWGITF